MRTISVANQKGGCGKTTTAINLASAIADSGKKVLIIDLDPQAHASFGLGVTSQMADRTIYNALTDTAEKRRNIADCILNVSKGLDIAPSNILLSTLEQELKDKEDAVSKLHQAIAQSELKYDYIIIDCPPSLGFLTFNALRAADIVIVPIDMSAFSLMGVSKLLGMLELIKVKINHAPRVNALATIFDKRTKYSQIMLEEIKSLFRDQLLNTVIRMNVALKKAVAKGVSVIAFERESNGAIDHLALAQEILQQEEVKFGIAMVPALSSPIEDALKNVSQEITKSIETALKEVEFKVTAPGAKEIYIVGDFNHWKMNDECRLSRFDDGHWEKKLGLAPGRYKYKFVVDGEWTLDTQNNDREQNAFGTFDSILKI